MKRVSLISLPATIISTFARVETFRLFADRRETQIRRRTIKLTRLYAKSIRTKSQRRMHVGWRHIIYIREKYHRSGNTRLRIISGTCHLYNCFRFSDNWQDMISLPSATALKTGQQSLSDCISHRTINYMAVDNSSQYASVQDLVGRY